MELIFESWFCILQLRWICLLVPIQSWAKVGLRLWVYKFILVLLFINHCISYLYYNCKPTFAHPCIPALCTCVELLGFSDHVICEREHFTSLLPIWIPFISLSYLIALARTSSSILNRSGKVGVLDLRGKAFRPPSLGMMLVVHFSYTVLYYVEVLSFYF